MSSKSDSEGASVTTANRIGLELNKVDKDMFTRCVSHNTHTSKHLRY